MCVAQGAKHGELRATPSFSDHMTWLWRGSLVPLTAPRGSASTAVRASREGRSCDSWYGSRCNHSYMLDAEVQQARRYHASRALIRIRIEQLDLALTALVRLPEHDSRRSHASTGLAARLSSSPLLRFFLNSLFTLLPFPFIACAVAIPACPTRRPSCPLPCIRSPSIPQHLEGPSSSLTFTILRPPSAPLNRSHAPTTSTTYYYCSTVVA